MGKTQSTDSSSSEPGWVANSTTLSASSKISSEKESMSTQQIIQHIWVIRRELSGMFPKFRKIAHSGILVKTNENKLFIIEYSEDSQAHARYVGEMIENPSQKWIDCGGYRWFKQVKGVSVINQTISVEEMKITMQKLANLHGQYDKLKNNCHIQQESTRLYYNLTGGMPLDYQKLASEKVSKL